MKGQHDRRRRWVRFRTRLLTVAFVLFAGSLVHRAYELQVVRAPRLRQMAEAQWVRDIQLAPKRGTIYDRNGVELAVSVDAQSIWANPRVLRRANESPKVVARRLANALGVGQQVLARRLASDKYFVWIKRQVTPREAAFVRAMDIPGVSSSREARRYYPNRELAAQLLGFANVDGVGIEGLELQYEDLLRGELRKASALTDRRGKVVFSQNLFHQSSERGHDLTLTVDKTIQSIAEREAAMAVGTFEARAASIIAMDPKTGEILAMANHPTFNANEPGQSPVGHRRNRAITDRFEPGSTIKPFTVAGALAAGTIHPRQQIYCEEGALQVAEYTIHDSRPHKYLTPAEILAYSSNIGTSKIGGTLGRKGLFRILRRFGFGERSGVPLPGETAGILRHHRRWYDMDAATVAFGQGMSVTTLQLATAMSVLANGGKLMRPRLIRRVSDAAGKTIEEPHPETRRQVVPTGVASLLSDMLTLVTAEDGTGAEAALDEYLVAGKTGTAQKADYVSGGYAKDRWTASFVGYAPADDPRLVVAVVVDEPVIAHYGGTVAGPPFRRMVGASLRHMGVPPSSGGSLVATKASASSTAPVEQPEQVDMVLPSPGVNEVVVPDAQGRTAPEAIRAADAAGLIPQIIGSGVVGSQDPPAGSIAQLGAQLRMKLVLPYERPGTTLSSKVGAEAVATNIQRARAREARR